MKKGSLNLRKNLFLRFCREAFIAQEWHIDYDGVRILLPNKKEEINKK